MPTPHVQVRLVAGESYNVDEGPTIGTIGAKHAHGKLLIFWRLLKAEEVGTAEQPRASTYPLTD